MDWKKTAILFCIYGITKEFRPATPFLTPFLISSYKNLTLEEVYGQIFPIWTYSYMFSLVPIFILTDVLRYKPIIVLEGACLSITWAIIVWGEGVRQMQLMQMFFGVASASKVAYYSYMYAVVDKKHYRKVTSYARSAALVGKLLGFGLAQVLISTGIGSYFLLNQISLIAVCIVFFIAIALPAVPSRGVLNQVLHEPMDDLTFEGRSQKEQLTQDETGNDKLGKDERALILDALRSFSIFKDNMTVLKWSLWWSLMCCGIYQICNYTQSLWIEMQPDHSKVENGLIEFLVTLIGAILAFLAQFPSIKWEHYEGIALVIPLATIAILIAIISQTSQILIAYIGHICAMSTYYFFITVASGNIACHLPSESYGFVFGCNTFAAVVLQTVLTLVVVDSHGLNLDIREQFAVYAGYFAAVAALFMVIQIFSTFQKAQDNNKNDSLQKI
ncbi:hypothetical protein V3C99_018879 [Haemonchus contortus]|uniref:Thiamine transporter 2 n=1 Tax=Haemonchus contortus TaxID=6289 RepID=A0A7I4Z028_HAECO|nr:Reduced folate carrier domain containing protein [Haemonchus contortus]